MNKKSLYFILATAMLAIVAILFFFPDDVEGNVLQQADTMQGLANGREVKDYREATGENSRWTNSLFGGMPNFQIAPSYKANSWLDWVGKVFMLGLPYPANLLFIMMMGFFIMGLCMKMKWYVSLFGAVAWGFSTYFIILIGAGHIWKFVTLAYIPPTIGGLALLYRRKYLAGTALTALFGALQLQSNHPQMTYYFLFVVAALVLTWLVIAIREKKMKHWSIATACAVVAAILAVGVNSSSLYNSYEYSKETVRGRATELTTPGGDNTGGMKRSDITSWSYGVDETFTLLLPNVKGGATIKPVGGQNQLLSVADVNVDALQNLSPEELQFVYQFPQYFGNQPMTNGPVYVGAFVLMLAILALFLVKSPVKWALLAVSILAILLSWGHNFSWLTDIFIDYFPAYNKFRAVSSILVVVEFTIPLLAAMCLARLIEHPEEFRAKPLYLHITFGVGALICLLGWMFPSMFGDPFSVAEIEQLTEMGAFSDPSLYGIINAVKSARLSLVSSDALRSLIFILIGWGLLFLYLRGSIKKGYILASAVILLSLIDLYTINHRYVNSENFVAPVEDDAIFEMTAADRQILQDTSYYRVLDLDDMGGARSSYFHKTIGGYHAAKLTRYNDLLQNQIYKGNLNVIDMLNARYFIKNDSVIVNPEACGNAWWVHSIDYVPDANAEMAALDSLDTHSRAVADARFKESLGTPAPLSQGDTIYLTSYAPNKLTYKATTAKGGVAVFSEVYFPWGWVATIDGKPAEIGRVNYLLRAMKIAPGSHDVVMTFDPQSLRITDNVGVACVVIIYLLVLAALAGVIISIVAAHRKME